MEVSIQFQYLESLGRIAPICSRLNLRILCNFGVRFLAFILGAYSLDDPTHDGASLFYAIVLAVLSGFGMAVKYYRFTANRVVSWFLALSSGFLSLLYASDSFIYSQYSTLLAFTVVVAFTVSSYAFIYAFCLETYNAWYKDTLRDELKSLLNKNSFIGKEIGFRYSVEKLNEFSLEELKVVYRVSKRLVKMQSERVRLLQQLNICFTIFRIM